MLTLDFHRSLGSSLRSLPRRDLGRSAGSFPEQRLIIEPRRYLVFPFGQEIQDEDYPKKKTDDFTSYLMSTEEWNHLILFLWVINKCLPKKSIC